MSKTLERLEFCLVKWAWTTFHKHTRKITAAIYQPLVIDHPSSSPDNARVQSHVVPGQNLRLYLSKNRSANILKSCPRTWNKFVPYNYFDDFETKTAESIAQVLHRRSALWYWGSCVSLVKFRIAISRADWHLSALAKTIKLQGLSNQKKSKLLQKGGFLGAFLAVIASVHRGLLILTAKRKIIP